MNGRALATRANETRGRGGPKGLTMLLIAIREAHGRLAETFKERFVEWGLSASLFVWGAMVLNSPGLFDHEFYAPMRRAMSQTAWGSISLLVGTIGLAALYRNGAWKRTPLLRMIASTFRLIVWGGLSIGALAVSWRSPNIAYTAFLFAMDAVCLVLASRDHGKVLFSQGVARDARY